jgi:hypothetical protein
MPPLYRVCGTVEKRGDTSTVEKLVIANDAIEAIKKYQGQVPALHITEVRYVDYVNII